MNRIGEKHKANNGQMMTIVDYRNYNDVDVEFEDNTIVQHRSYHNIKAGRVRNPNLLKTERLGERQMANNGQMMTIIAFRSNNDIDVEFDDVTIVCHRTYGNFAIGNIGNPKSK